MDPALIAALAAVAGSTVGGLASFATTYITQRHQIRRERLMRELERREALYGEFIVQAAELFVDSLDKSLEEPEKIVAVAASMGRIRLVSDDEVASASVNVLNAILASYRRPPIARNGILDETNISFKEPLDRFSHACRAEREAMLREI